MNFYSKTLFLDQFTPVSIYEKTKALYPKELSFLFESSISSSNDGNFSYIIIGARERIWYKNNECFFKNEIGTIEKVDNNPLLFLKKYYKDSLYNIHADSGGLQAITLGKKIDSNLKTQVYNIQSQYADIGMSFDEIPITTTVTPALCFALFTHLKDW